MDFEARVDVHRMHDSDDSVDPHAFVAELRVHCGHCGQAFAFKGMRSGFSYAEPMVDASGTMVSLPLASPSEIALSDVPGLYGVLQQPEEGS